MITNRQIRSGIFAFMVLAFVLGVAKLFFLRFEAGDVYPAYSSLRSDPLGTQAFHDSLENLNSMSVSRNYHALQRLQFTERTTFLYLGAEVFDTEYVSKDFGDVFDRLTFAGGRLVMSFLPAAKKPADWRLPKCFRAKKEIKGQSSDKKSMCVALKERWGVSFAFKNQPAPAAERSSSEPAETNIKGLPASISWHSALYFDNLESPWQVIYEDTGRPLIIERPLGSGTLVLSADSFFFSNESLRSERHPDLLAWLIGPNSNVVFDETHFGIYMHPGVVSLIQKYRFHWFVLGVIALAVLFIWKNSVYFVPPPRKEFPDFGQDFISDRDSIQGLISLIRRNISTRRILQTCMHEWERTFQKEKRFQAGKLERIKTAVYLKENHSKKHIDPVIGYQRISRILSEGRHHE